jgi:hypothetical protein
VLNPSKTLELVSRGVELSNFTLHALPSAAAHVPHNRGVLFVDYLPSGRIVDNEKAALMSIIDEVTIGEHKGLLSAPLKYQQEAPQLRRRQFC